MGIHRFGTFGVDGTCLPSRGGTRNPPVTCPLREPTTSSSNVCCLTAAISDCLTDIDRSAVVADFELRNSVHVVDVGLLAVLPVNGHVQHLGRWQGNVPAYS